MTIAEVLVVLLLCIGFLRLLRPLRRRVTKAVARALGQPTPPRIIDASFRFTDKKPKDGN